MKMKYIKPAFNELINGHSIELYELNSGKYKLQHERYYKRSNIFIIFDDLSV